MAETTEETLVDSLENLTKEDNETQQDFDYDYDTYFYYVDISTQIWKYAPGFIIVAGVLGNFLSALVMTRLNKGHAITFFTQCTEITRL